ncbi:MAG TPA: UdgX family uracil-DNA binding protein [Hyphomonadaceae bacterium]|nr:UdgX family uracil-DNA binding protein [Hyphomonadaceae bacterium]
MDPTVHQHITLNGGADLQGFRQALRILTWSNIPPEQISWSEQESAEQFGGRQPLTFGMAGKPIILQRMAAELISNVVCHSLPGKYAMLYRLVWRMQHDEPRLLSATHDPLVMGLNQMASEVRRDVERMHAGLCFREINDAEIGERFIAWFEPEHFILEPAAKHFIERFRSLDWTILTPKGSLCWDRKELAIGPPVGRSASLEVVASEISWRTCHESTFNPAHVHIPTLRRYASQQATRKSWRNRSDAACGLIPAAWSRVDGVIEQETAMPAKRNLKESSAAAAEEPKSLAALNRVIEASPPMVEGSHKAVLGEGPMHPAIAFVGEQPGDQEDIEGRPFVGPAGKLLNRAMEEAGIDRKKTYVTNAVKHFKFVQRGKRRLHQTPTAGEVKQYRWWLEKELGFVEPKLVVALGATAVHALAGKALPIGKNRGPAKFGGFDGYITVHPSFLLRLPDEDARQREYKALVADLKRIDRLSHEASRA